MKDSLHITVFTTLGSLRCHWVRTSSFLFREVAKSAIYEALALHLLRVHMTFEYTINHGI